MNDAGDNLGDLEPAQLDSAGPANDAPANGSGFVITDNIPPPKRYAHFGKRRRSFTDELFRCQYVDKISRSDLVCNSLLWRNRPEELRKHLLEHLTPEEIAKKTDQDVLAWYTEAKHIMLEGIPEDLDFSSDDEFSDDEDECAHMKGAPGSCARCEGT